MRHASLAFALLLLLCGCARGAKVQGTNVLDQDTRGQVVFATTECVVPNSDGQRCDKKTCKADQKSDCQKFASGCLEYGNHYSGTQEGGDLNAGVVSRGAAFSGSPGSCDPGLLFLQRRPEWAYL